jgi:valyl-tRNA synthetase
MARFTAAAVFWNSEMAKRIEKATRKEYPDGITAYGTDPLRFTFYSIATRTRTIRFDIKRVEGYRNFCNKLWNAAIFVSGNINDNESRLGSTDVELSTIDHWIISEFQKTAAAVNLAMETYRFDLAAKEIYEFVWVPSFCAWVASALFNIGLVSSRYQSQNWSQTNS